jgi:hypothetical protein
MCGTRHGSTMFNGRTAQLQVKNAKLKTFNAKVQALEEIDKMVFPTLTSMIMISKAPSRTVSLDDC